MTTTTNKSKQHAGNGDTESHYDKAHVANAVKYHQLTGELTRDEAKDIVERLIKSDSLHSAAFYTNEIAKEYKRRDTLEKRAQAEKDRLAKVEADRKAKAEAEAEREEAEQSGDYTLDPLVEAQIRDFIAKGATKSVIQGMLKVLTKLNKVQIAKTIEDLMPERARSESLDDRFNKYCVDAMRSEDDLKKWITENGSDNFIKFTTHLLKRAEFFNAIHAFYNK
jgi:hypothetical protein